jgi:REP element-mobilizing transposase RayT
MARPLRIEYPGALYDVTSRGNAGKRIFRCDKDREYFLDLLGFIIERFHWLCHAWCLMDNHYHLVLETPEGNLSRGMRQLNGIYTQKYNWKYTKTGHVFQGRYKAILVDKESYLLELCRYVVLNPVRANMVKRPQDWRWSSYRSTTGRARLPQWFTTDWILAQFSRRRKRAQRLYHQFIMEGITKETPWKDLKGQIFLGDKGFIEECKRILDASTDLQEIPRLQRYAERPVLAELLDEEIQRNRAKRNRIIYQAHVTYGYTLKEIADHLRVHYTTVSKVVNKDKQN